MATVGTHPLLARARELIASDRHEAAAQPLIAYLRDNRGDPRALAMLGAVAMKLGALGQAEDFLAQAIRAGARDFETRRTLALVALQQERPARAIPMFEALAAENPDPGLKALLAGLYDKVGRNDEARALFAALAEAEPDKPQLWIAYGHTLRAAGMVDEAVAAYRRAAALDYEFGEAWWGLASIKRTVLTDADMAEMRRGLAVAIDPRNQAPLNFAMARALHDRGQYADAFAHYAEGNRLRAEAIGYDAEELTGEIAEIERRADAAFFAPRPALAGADAVPVFIVSLPRSGSTLLEQMLGSHPDIEPVGELPYIPAILRSFMEMATRRGKVTVPQAVLQMPDEMARAFAADYLERAALHRRTDRPVFIDKLPHNWSNILFIRRILPQAKFLDIRRPALDCCFSNFTQSFTSAHASSFTLHDIGRSYRDNVRLMDHLDRVAPGLVRHIDYAALVADPRPQLEGALAYLGLPWDDAVLDFHRLERVVRTPSSEQVRRPLNRDGMAVWRPYSEYLGPLRDVLGPLAEA